MATPPDGTKLSLGKLGRATAVGNSDYTSKTSLNSAGRDSGTGKTSIGDLRNKMRDFTIDITFCGNCENYINQLSIVIKISFLDLVRIPFALYKFVEQFKIYF